MCLKADNQIRTGIARVEAVNNSLYTISAYRKDTFLKIKIKSLNQYISQLNLSSLQLVRTNYSQLGRILQPPLTFELQIIFTLLCIIWIYNVIAISLDYFNHNSKSFLLYSKDKAMLFFSCCNSKSSQSVRRCRTSHGLIFSYLRFLICQPTFKLRYFNPVITQCLTPFKGLSAIRFKVCISCSKVSQTLKPLMRGQSSEPDLNWH